MPAKNNPNYASLCSLVYLYADENDKKNKLDYFIKLTVISEVKRAGNQINNLDYCAFKTVCIQNILREVIN